MYHSGDRRSPTTHQTPPTSLHIKGIVPVPCRGDKFPAPQTLLASRLPENTPSTYLEQTASWY